MLSSSVIIRSVFCGCGHHLPGFQKKNYANISSPLTARNFITKGADVSIGFIGGGNLARAIGNGILENNLAKPSNVHVSEPYEPMQKTWKDWGTNVTTENGKVVENCEIIFLTVKPTILNVALTGVNDTLSGPVDNKLFVSALAGVTLAALKNVILPVVPNARIIRSTLNTPLLVGSGCTVLSGDETVTKKDISFVKNVMAGMGMCHVMPEHLIDAAGGIVGCGPAYMFIIIEALADGAVKMGVPRDLAIKFAAQTMYGSAKMVLKTGKHPGELKDQVCSPGGTTIVGVHALERVGLRSALMNAVEEAVKKSAELNGE